MKRCLVALAAAGALAASGWSSPSATPRTARAGCGPGGARTLAADSRARVYSVDGAVYGCATPGARRYRLVRAGPCPGTPQLGPVAVSGIVAAYGLRSCGVDFSSAQVVTARLSTGDRLSSHPAIEGPAQAESFQSVSSIVVKASGAVAWIASSSSIASHRQTIEVVAIVDGQARVLDSGAAISVRSLRLTGSRLTWRDAGAPRSATLR